MMKRRWLSFALVLALVLTLMPPVPHAAAAGVWGDVDGDNNVTSTDARLVLQFSVQKIDESDIDIAFADVDGNGDITSTDARLILQFYVNKIARFPVQEDPDEEKEPEIPDFGEYVPGNISTVGPEAGYTFRELGDVVDYAPSNMDDTTKQLGYFALTVELNPGLPFNIACDMYNHRLTALLPAGVDLTAVIPTFVYYGDAVLLNGQPVVSDVTALDLSQPQILTLTARDGTSTQVQVIVETLNTGLPSMAVTLDGYTSVNTITKEEYTTASFYLGGGDSTICPYVPAENLHITGKIKGRGNSSWVSDEKKSYTVKLDTKTELLGMAASKNWAIVANYKDKSLLRNLTAYYLAQAAEIPYIMEMRPVDMWINGEYWGTYNLTEKIELEPNRVNIADVEKPTDKDFVDKAANEVGYLLEFDGHVAELNAGTDDVIVIDPHTQWEALGWTRYEHSYYDLDADSEKSGYIYYNPDTDEHFFRVPYLGKWVTIKKPSTENLNHKPEMRDYIFKKVMELDSALKNRDRDVNKITELLDIDSFARWAIVEEMMANVDSSFHSSVYMSLDVGGKFVFGPAWDFDLSAKNCDYWSSNLGHIFGTNWGRYVFNDTAIGRQTLLNAWDDFYGNITGEGTLPVWDAQYMTTFQMIYESAMRNFERWDILDKVVKPNPSNFVWEDYEMYVSQLRGFLAGRITEMGAYMDERR